MIKSSIFKIKKDIEIGKGMLMKKNDEIEVVMDVCYVHGNMVPPEFQNLFYSFIIKNPELFILDDRRF
mgnify:CR=1 FL=1